MDVFGRASMSMAGVLVVLLLSGCGTGITNDSGPSSKTAVPDGKKPDQETSKIIKSKDGLSQVRVPADWKEIDGLNKAAVLQVGNRLQKAYFVVRTFSKRDWPGDENLQKYAKNWVKEVREFFENSRLQSGPTLLTINGRPAVQSEFAGLAPENKAHTMLLHTTVCGRKHFHELLAWTNQRRIEENRAVLQAVIASFTETRDKTDAK